VNIQRTESTSIARELNRLNEAISRRAYELYEENHLPSVLDNWIAAEKELVQRPTVELHEEAHNVEVLVGLNDVEPEDIEVHVSAQDLLIRARRQLQARLDELERLDDSDAIDGPSRHQADLVSVVHLADEIDPDSVNAEFEDGRLRLRMHTLHEH
jgi:HSP20 family molecular chaperone IbpA